MILIVLKCNCLKRNVLSCKIEKKASGEYYLDANIYLIIVTPGVKHMAKGVKHNGQVGH